MSPSNDPTPSDRLATATAPTTEPHGPVGAAARLALVMIGVGILVLPYFVACILLLPSRVTRLRLGNLVGAAAGRWVHRVVGLTHQLHGLPLADLAPAIYVQNHTGTLDLWLAMQLCPAPGSGTVKREVLRVPFVGLGYLLSGHLLLDRGNRTRAIKAMTSLTRLVQKHRISVWILPEGTRARDGRLLPFKKGFAHLALATRLPVVPVVIHDGHRFWARGLAVRPGCVQVEVLPPIPTVNWSVDRLDEHIAEVRQVFLERLGDHQIPTTSSTA